MASFSIKNAGIKNGVEELDSMASELASIQSQINGIKNALGFKIASSGAIRSRLGNISANVQGHRRGMRNMSQGLEQSLQKYNNTEKSICGRAKTETGTYGVMKPENDLWGNETWQVILERLKDTADFIFDFHPTDGNGFDWKDLLLIGITTYDEFTQWYDDLKDSIIDSTTISKSATASWNYWEAGVSGEYGSAGVSVLAANAYASAEAGLFTKTEDGRLLCNPHIDAKAGASFSLLEASAEAHMGDEMFGAKASASATVGKVDASAKVSAGVFDEDGNLDLRLKASASAEAIAVEAKAEAGITVLGTEAKVSGSVNVGIGAHADIGYEDGVFSFDIGASLGIGASIAFEVDIGGTIDAVKDKAKSMFMSWLGG